MFAVLIFMRSFGVRDSDQVLVDSLSKTYSAKNSFSAGNYGHSAAAGVVGKVTLWRWIHIPEFKEQYRLARREAVSASQWDTSRAPAASLWWL